MTTTSNTEIQQLKELIKDGFDRLDRKIDEVKDDLKNLSTKVESIPR